MTQQIRLDNDADHEISDCGTSGTVYLLIPMYMSDLSVEIYFETDDRQNLNLISIGDAFQEIEGISEDYNYTLIPEHEPMIKAVIDQFLWDNPIDDGDEYEPDWHDQRTYGLSNSDFLYG